MVATTSLAQQTENCGATIKESNEPEFVLYNGLRVYQDGKIERKLKKAGWREIPNKVNSSTGYNCIKTYDRKMAKRHRIIKAAYTPEFDINDPKQIVDHIDHDKINNNLRNLRVVSPQGNQWNRRGKGYYYHKASGKFQVTISINNKVKYVGCYKTEEEARNAYLQEKEKHHVIIPLC